MVWIFNNIPLPILPIANCQFPGFRTQQTRKTRQQPQGRLQISEKSRQNVCKDAQGCASCTCVFSKQLFELKNNDNRSETKNTSIAQGCAPQLATPWSRLIQANQRTQKPHSNALEIHITQRLWSNTLIAFGCKHSSYIIQLCPILRKHRHKPIMATSTLRGPNSRTTKAAQIIKSWDGLIAHARCFRNWTKKMEKITATSGKKSEKFGVLDRFVWAHEIFV